MEQFGPLVSSVFDGIVVVVVVVVVVVAVSEVVLSKEDVLLVDT